MKIGGWKMEFPVKWLFHGTCDHVPQILCWVSLPLRKSWCCKRSTFGLSSSQLLGFGGIYKVGVKNQ